jgi:Mce-associated membrane protein
MYKLAALIAVLATAAAATETARAWTRHADDEAAQAALSAARQAVVNFTEIDPKDLDASIRRVAGAATGDFRSEYAKDSATLRQAYAANKLQAHGEVLSAGVTGAARDSATVLLVVDQSVRKGPSGEPQLRHYRMRLGMARQQGRWLVSSLAFVS